MIKLTMNFNDIDIKGISYDSRKTKPCDVFIAISGLKTDGYNYIPEAINNGAVVIVAERDFEAPPPVKKVIVENARKSLAELSNKYYHFPSKKLRLIGITGTNGKTTTAYLIESILSTAGYKTGLIGTVETKINGKSIDSILTTPESLELQALLAQMLQEGVTHVVMEVSSHSLAQFRVAGCEFDVVIYTNLTHDHLDYHKTMEAYLEEKKKLFKMLKPNGVAIINVDDPYSKQIAEVVETEVMFYGLKEARHETMNTIYASFDVSGMRMTIDGLEIRTKLFGEYNAYNILAAYRCGEVFHIRPEIIKKGIEKAFVPGRLEEITNNLGFKIFVDFAHSPDALQKLLETLKPLAQGKLILVFGCPGDRDKAKRPIMGRIAAELADVVIVTTDDPHTENPRKIIDEILQGIPLRVELDRKTAIEKALSLAKKNDILVIAGRGHEKYQDFNGKNISFDDREVVRKILSDMGTK